MNIFKVLIDGLIGILFFIDSIVYSFIPILYRLLLYLANVDLVTGNIPVQALIQRVYILVGVFMLFKLSFSILNYIINPDAFSDQSKGFTNLVRRVLVAIVLLVGIPWLFSEAYVIQNKIITSGILPRLILGESIDYSNSNGNDTLEDSIYTSARDVQFMLFGPFFGLNYESESGDLISCSPSFENATNHILGTNGMAGDSECMTTVAELMDDSSDVQASGANLRDFFRYEDETTGEIIDRRKFDEFGGLASWTLSNGDRAIKYYPIISTLCGGYLVFLLLSFCIDIGARVIRLFFLQILSPIAVVSSIDPTSSGDRLKDWAKECVKVWASLFLRLLVIFLIIQLVRVISNSVYSGTIFATGYSSSSQNLNNINAWIYVLLILGVFQAAKSIPDLIEKATGIKMSGELQLNPFKALRENAGVGLGLAGLGIGATAVASGAANTLAGIVEGKGIVGTARSAVGGFFGGGYRSLRGAMNGEKGMKNFSNSFGSAMFARQQRDDLNRQGSTWYGRLMADVNRHLGLMNAGQRQEMEYARDEAALENAKRETARHKEDYLRDFSDYSSAMSAIDGIIANDKQVKIAQAQYDEAVKTGNATAIQAAENALNNQKKRSWRDLRAGTGTYGAANHDLVQTYLDRIQLIRGHNQTIGSYAPVTNASDEFDKASLYAAQNEVSRVEYAYSTGVERVQADLESELQARKTTDEWRANELDNSSRGVKSPQPEGWKPSGEISGAYGPQYGPGVWGQRGGNNGPGHRP